MADVTLAQGPGATRSPSRSGEIPVAFLTALFFAIPPLREIVGLPNWAYAVPLVLLALITVIRHSRSLRLRIPRPVGIYVSLSAIFFFWLAVSALWTRSPAQYQTDLLLLLALMVLCVVMASVLSLRVVDFFTTAICIIGALVSAYVLGTYSLEEAVRAYAFELEDFYLVTATPIGVAAVGASLRTFTDPDHRRWWAALAFVSLIGLALSLARGALLSAVFIIVVSGILLLFLRRADRSSLWALVRSSLGRVGGVLVILGASAATFYVAFQVERTASRLMRMLSGSELRAGGRGELWGTAIENIAASPIFGYGLGSNGIMSGTLDHMHPHNLLLQTWLDGGVIAAVLLLALLAMPFVMLVRGWPSDSRWQRRCIPLVGIYLFLVLEFAKSSNFYGARILFLTGIMAVWALSARKRPMPITEGGAS